MPSFQPTIQRDVSLLISELHGFSHCELNLPEKARPFVLHNAHAKNKPTNKANNIRRLGHLLSEFGNKYKKEDAIWRRGESPN